MSAMAASMAGPASLPGAGMISGERAANCALIVLPSLVSGATVKGPPA